MNRFKTNLILHVLIYPVIVLTQDTDFILQELKSLRTDLRKQEALTDTLSKTLTETVTEQSKLKTDVSNLNYKTVSLYNSVSEALDLLSDELEVLQESVRSQFTDTNTKISDLSQTIDAREELSGSEMEPDQIQEFKSTISTLQEQLYQQNTDMVGVHDDLYSSIDQIKGLLNSGMYTLTSDLQQTNFDIKDTRLDFRELKSTVQTSVNSMDKFEQSSKDLVETNLKFEQFRLEMIQQIAILKYEEGTWVEFQRRGDYGNKPDYFKKTYKQYEDGFGDPYREFWLGLKKLYQLTRGGQASLRIQVTDWQNNTYSGDWTHFRIGKGPYYTLQVSGYSGNIGDSLRIANGMHFSTMDKDMDRSEWNCSVDQRGGGGWWFNACGLENLNGVNLGSNGHGYSGILWFLQGNSEKSLQSSVMMIKINK